MMAENLYCPRCAKPFTTDTSYCRTCGLELGGVAKIVKGDAENAPVTVSRPNFNGIRYGVVLFIIGLVIGLLNGALRDFALFPDKWGKVVFFMFIAAGLLAMGSAFVFPTKRYRKRKPADSPAELETAPLAGELSPADTAELDPIVFPKDRREPVMAEPGSITERTTRNLE
jgi:hypothetical protein